MLLRLSAPDTAPHRERSGALALLAHAYDLTLQRMGGEQGALLAATTPRRARATQHERTVADGDRSACLPGDAAVPAPASGVTLGGAAAAAR